MKRNEIHPELLNIDRMKSKPFTKKDFDGVSAFIKEYKENNVFDDIECHVLSPYTDVFIIITGRQFQ